jgi:hypothetical protein
MEEPVKISRRCQRESTGQATTEFLISCIVLVPLFFGAIYAAKYSDVKQQTIQASRYAAMDSAQNPGKPIATLQDETRVRFFMDHERRNNGAIKSTDARYAPDREKDLIAFWRDMSGRRMVDDFSQIRVNLSKKELGGVSEAQKYAGKFFGLDTKGLQQADVEVPLAAVKHFEPLANLPIRIGATTVSSAGAWNASGNAEVKTKALGPLAPAKGGIEAVNNVLDWIYVIFEQSGGPNLFCVNPNVVPSQRLDSYQNYAPCS